MKPQKVKDSKLQVVPTSQPSNPLAAEYKDTFREKLFQALAADGSYDSRLSLRILPGFAFCLVFVCCLEGWSSAPCLAASSLFSPRILLVSIVFQWFIGAQLERQTFVANG